MSINNKQKFFYSPAPIFEETSKNSQKFLVKAPIFVDLSITPPYLKI
jgi:hypothetical protein